MDAERLREELYENCLTLRAQARDAEKAAADKAAGEGTVPTQASAEEAVVEEVVADDGADESFEDIIKPPPMQ